MKFQFPSAPTPNDQVIVADSREKVADSREPKAYDLAELLNDSEKVVDPGAKVDKPKGKTSEAQLRANQKWQKKQSRMTFRMSPELRTQLNNHAATMGESATAFIIRAIKEQIERDSREAL